MKRRLFKLVLFLLLGAIVNVAVAWGCAYWMEIDLFPVTRLDNLILGASPIDERSTFWAVWYRKQRGMGVVISGEDNYGIWAKQQTAEDALPHWSTVQVPSRGSKQTDIGNVETASGWPMYAMSWTARHSVQVASDPLSRRIEIIYGLEIEPPDNFGRGQRALPLHPLWLGFAINTIFYAAILWLPFAPFQLRRYVRVKRGHCIKCGYDLRGAFSAGCSECGWRRDNEA